jgi:hypothetical protein
LRWRSANPLCRWWRQSALQPSARRRPGNSRIRSPAIQSHRRLFAQRHRRPLHRAQPSRLLLSVKHDLRCRRTILPRPPQTCRPPQPMRLRRSLAPLPRRRKSPRQRSGRRQRLVRQLPPLATSLGRGRRKFRFSCRRPNRRLAYRPSSKRSAANIHRRRRYR